MDCIFSDASDKHDRMSINTTDVDAMKMKGTYLLSQKFTNLEKFERFVESNSVFGTSLSTNYYCESDSGVKLATYWLRKRKGKTG